MATPDYKVLLRGSTTWREKFEDVEISLSHHGYDDGSRGYPFEAHPGTWCYYLHLRETMFHSDDWKRLWLPDRETEWGVTQDYWELPDFDFHGGCTFYEKREFYDKHEKRLMGIVKVGCDYNHIWDEEAYYPDTYESVLFDAKNSVKRLIEVFPNRRRTCAYSGVWDDEENFYTAQNGVLVHVSKEAIFTEDNWPTWRRAV